MSAVLPCRAYNNASDLPPEFWAAFVKNEAAANIVFPFAKKALDASREADASNDPNQLWIVAYDDTGKDAEFVLSCTQGLLGNYPIFIYTPKSSAQLAQDESDGKDVTGSLTQLVLCLLREVSPQRVFSVFSIAYVAKKFANIFKEHTHQEHGIFPLEDPYYDATFTFCTRETLNKSPDIFSIGESEDILIALCQADISHLEELKVLCKEFSDTSPPYGLDDKRAEDEARALITKQQAWVHMIKKGDEDWEIACLVAATRESDNVTAITKVFTAEKWRGHRCAGRLLYRVCQDILRKKERVVLYVGNGQDLVPARKVYHKVGFQGLAGNQEQKVENVEGWLEIGFEGTTLGYW